MKKTLLSVSAMFLAGSGISSGAAILLDFGAVTVASPYLALDPAHATGAIPGTETFWNKVTTSAPVTSLFYSDASAAAGVSITMGQESATESSSINFATAISNLALAGTGGNAPNQQSLLGTGSIYGDNSSSTAAGRDGFFGGGANAAAGLGIGVRIDGLAAGTWELYTMARNTNTNAVAAAGMSIYTTAGASTGIFSYSSLTASSQANTTYATEGYAGQYTSFVEGVNYVKTVVTVAEGDSVYLAVEGSTAAERRGFLNNIAIVSVPETSTAMLGALGTLALLRRSRRA